ncbi:PAAR domain-containing protein [Labedaea rhizosphaerae]|uniref:Putative Zn-binding protein involved in type VI secretion n=1 Tax=Labedaea rhizosphaerae TaxID=598644 RepID=A0A4R6SHP3_LABRH|nr:PAAR domain-containing protein [Labedaea rhizosphaerae]TDQ01137.1 putative Zn-binding protein involved in type VI secretion [Labedaea rhizosphaerae]
MSQPAAKMGDAVTGTDTHIVMVPSPGGPVPTPQPFPFNAKILNGCSTNVLIAGKPAAVVGSEAVIVPPHVPSSGSFQKPPTNNGKIVVGSPTVLINGKPAARNGDKVLTCNDPVPLPVGTIIAVGTVLVA